MSKQDKKYNLYIEIEAEPEFSNSLSEALMHNVNSDTRVSTNIELNGDKVSIFIKASDLNIMLAVNNSIMQAIKMIESVDKYE